jgi:hypothetical protein
LPRDDDSVKEGFARALCEEVAMTHSRCQVRVTAVALCALVGTILVATAPAAVATDLRVALRDDGAVQARGAAMVLMTTVTCDPDTTFFPVLSIQVTQRLAGGTLARGTDNFPRPIRCTGSPQRLRVAIRATGQFSDFPVSSAPPFAPTSAFVTASLLDCNDTCQGVSTSRTVKLAKDVPTFSQPRATTTRSRVYPDAATATLEAGGAGVTVRVPYKCAPTVTGRLDVALTQRTSSHTITSADVPTAATCTGLKRVGVAVFHADTPTRRRGDGDRHISSWSARFARRSVNANVPTPIRL